MTDLTDVPLRHCRERTALAIITSAFIDDPVERWLYPDDQSYRRDFPRFAWALGNRAVDERTAWCSDNEDAVALWLPPGVTADDEPIIDLLTATVATAKHADMYAALKQMGSAHPSEPHWYLAWLAVDHNAQGHGLGAELLTRCLARVDAAHQPAYLETPNPRTVSFYRRHGFRDIGHTRTTSCPPITFMRRPAR